MDKAMGDAVSSIRRTRAPTGLPSFRRQTHPRRTSRARPPFSQYGRIGLAVGDGPAGGPRRDAGAGMGLAGMDRPGPDGDAGADVHPGPDAVAARDTRRVVRDRPGGP